MLRTAWTGSAFREPAGDAGVDRPLRFCYNPARNTAKDGRIMERFQQEYIEARKAVIARDFPGLNDRQREAVMATEGPLLILAGAGSGKTTVLIHRVANLIKYGRASDCELLPADADDEKLSAMQAYLAGDDTRRREAEAAAVLDPAEPWRILAITFTNKAAGELKERLQAKLGPAAEDIWARTFHSACVRILRRNAGLLGYPESFTIYDAEDRVSVMKRIIKERGLDEKMFPPKWVLTVIDRAKDRLRSPADLRAEADKRGDVRLQGAAELYRLYTARLLEAGAMDFEDLIYNTVRLLQEYPDVSAFYQNRFRYVLIDEYQDTNNLQYLLAQLLAGGRENICVVGDDDQSIYSFRGATIENILSFEQQYDNVRVIRLEQNYRSTGHILEAANGVVSHNGGRKGKRLWTDAGAGERITLYAAKNEEDEAQYIVSRVLTDVERGGRLQDHAVLYRMNAQSRAIEQAFLRNGIRPRIVKGNPFFERAEIKDLLAYFFVVENPADELRLVRIINTPARGIGQTTIEKLRSAARENGSSVFEAAAGADRFPELARAAEKLKGFVRLMEELAHTARTEGIEALYDALLEKTGYARLLEEEKTEEALNRLENIRELKSFIATYCRRNGKDASLAGFLDEVSLYTDLQNMSSDEDTVTLMTVHSAKGLEFPSVFIAGMEEGLFPSLQAIGESRQMEEERRLAYVAITRAKRRLTITSARQRMVFGQTAPHRVSRFVDEIPSEHIDRPYTEFRPTWFDAADETRPAQARKKPVRSTLQFSRQPQAPLPDIREGDRVVHKSFGSGTIRAMTPMGGDHLVEIDFDTEGRKKLMLRAASRYLSKEQ